MEDLRVTVVQCNLTWELPEKNRADIACLLEKKTEPTDLIILPEMFTSGFTMQPSHVAEPLDGPTVDWMAMQAAHYEAVLVGSLVIKEGGNFYNRLIWMRPDGTFDWYDKKHLFSLAGEHHHYKAGDQRLVVELNGWKLCPLVCYDLRFPVWSRNTECYDALLYVANWPNPRRSHWLRLLPARAIENQCYVIGVNRVGKDSNGHNYSGDSGVFDFEGTMIADSGEHEGIFTCTLSGNSLQDFRGRLPFLKDRDYFTLNQ